MPDHNITPARISKLIYQPGIARFQPEDIQQWIDDAYELAMTWNSSLSGNYLDQVVENLAVWNGKKAMPDLYATADAEYRAAKDVLHMFENKVQESETLPDDVDHSVYSRTIGKIPVRLFRDSDESTRETDDRNPRW